METTQLATIDPDIISSLVIKGDLSGLNQVQKLQYYNAYCIRLGLDPATQPFKILNLKGKEVLYCDRSGTQQLNKLHGVSHEIQTRETCGDLRLVTCRASLANGRFQDAIGVVSLKGLDGELLSNAIMKAETKAKRRATLDLLGLGILDETEIEGAIIGETKSCDELKAQYLGLLDQLEQVAGGYDSKLLPDNWKKEQNTDNFIKAIAAVSKMVDEERELRRGTLTPYTVKDMADKVTEAVAKDDYYVDQRKNK